MADPKTRKLEDHVEVKSFNKQADLFTALASDQFQSGHWVFRGQGSASWPLVPSLERFARTIADAPEIIEEYTLREFQRRAHHYSSDLPEKDNVLEWLALMRHHGSPTRLLDFTKSPYVAAFFAVSEAARDDSAAIWAINAKALKTHAAEVLKAETLNLGVAAVGRRCLDQNTSFSDPDIFNYLVKGPGPMPSVVAPVEPFRFNQRMAVQQGLFLCPFAVGVRLAFEKSLLNVLCPGRHQLVYKLVIEPSIHPYVLRDLHRMNVNYASLFPNLDGLARSLMNISKIRALTTPLSCPWDRDFAMSF